MGITVQWIGVLTLWMGVAYTTYPVDGCGSFSIQDIAVSLARGTQMDNNIAQTFSTCQMQSSPGEKTKFNDTLAD